MDFFIRHSDLRRAIALVLAVVVTSACMSLRTVQMPESYIPAQRPTHVVVTLVGGQTVGLYSPAIVGNTLTGYGRKGVDSTGVAIPLRFVQRVQAEQRDEGQTAVLIAVVALGVGLLAFAAIAVSQMCIGCGIASSFPRL